MFFFFNDTATTEIYTLSLHDALPISERAQGLPRADPAVARRAARVPDRGRRAGLRGRRDAVRAGPRGDHRPRRPPGAAAALRAAGRRPRRPGGPVTTTELTASQRYLDSFPTPVHEFAIEGLDVLDVPLHSAVLPPSAKHPGGSGLGYGATREEARTGALGEMAEKIGRAHV